MFFDLHWDPAVVALLLGHANANFTLTRYVGVRGDPHTALTESTDQCGRRVGDCCGGSSGHVQRASQQMFVDSCSLTGAEVAAFDEQSAALSEGGFCGCASIAGDPSPLGF